MKVEYIAYIYILYRGYFIYIRVDSMRTYVVVYEARIVGQINKAICANCQSERRRQCFATVKVDFVCSYDVIGRNSQV